jgi:hypothetical protein
MSSESSEQSFIPSTGLQAIRPDNNAWLEGNEKGRTFTYRERHALADLGLAEYLHLAERPVGDMVKVLDFGCGKVKCYSPTLQRLVSAIKGFQVDCQAWGVDREFSGVCCDPQFPDEIKYCDRISQVKEDDFDVARMLNVVMHLGDRYPSYLEKVVGKLKNGGILVCTQEVVKEGSGRIGERFEQLPSLTKVMVKLDGRMWPVALLPYEAGSWDAETGAVRYGDGAAWKAYGRSVEYLAGCSYRMLDVESRQQGIDLLVGEQLDNDMRALDYMERNSQEIYGRETPFVDQGLIGGTARSQQDLLS